MKKQIRNLLLGNILFSAFILVGCSDNNTIEKADPSDSKDRMITLAGALMGTEPGDGNGGTMVYSISKEDARNPEISINVYDNGYPVKSNRTARLQSSQDGKTLFNIAYTGDNGGEFSRYAVKGAGKFVQEDVSVNISQYAGTSPRWAKLFDGDKSGIAVNVANIIANNATAGANPEGAFKYYRGMATVLGLDLQNVLIKNYKQYEIPLSPQEELDGHCIFRLDSPVLNKAQDKLIIGTWMRKYNPATGLTEASFERLGSKSVVVDYPSLENPRVISSTVAHGDNSGYRSFNAFLSSDGNIYQATQRATEGSYILKINQNNEYDNTYVFSLDAALGVKNVYVDTWRYAGNGIAYALYSKEGKTQGYIARLDLNTKTATILNIPTDEALSFVQYQGFVVSGDEVFIAVTPTGKNGNIHIINSKTNEITKGATLINKPGNHYIGVF